MTDNEKLGQLLAEFGIEPCESRENAVVIMAGDGGVRGYMGFYALFKFDESGKFVSVGIFE